MKLASLIFGAGLVLASATAYADGEYSCGCHEPAPVKVKANSGVGNGGEGADTEVNDQDPGNSFANNQAAKNVGKPRSAASGNRMP